MVTVKVNTSECTFFLIFRNRVHSVNRNLQENILSAVKDPVKEIWNVWKHWSSFYTLTALSGWNHFFVSVHSWWLLGEPLGNYSASTLRSRHCGGGVPTSNAAVSKRSHASTSSDRRISSVFLHWCFGYGKTSTKIMFKVKHSKRSRTVELMIYISKSQITCLCFFLQVD